MFDNLLSEMSKAKYEPDPDLKEKKLATFKEEIAPYYLQKIDEIVKDNNGFVANGKVSLQDTDE